MWNFDRCMSLESHWQALVDDLLIIPDRQERLAVVVEKAKRMAPFPSEDKVEGNRVPGCVSAVWVTGRCASGVMHYRADADSPLVKGLVNFLVSTVHQQRPEEIVAATKDPLEEAGLLKDLSPTRRNGLTAVRLRLRALAEAALRQP